METRRARMTVVGVLSKAADVGLLPSVLLGSYAELFPIGPTKTESGSTVAAEAQQPLTKKQRQHAQKREALKEAKRERDARQQAAFAAHKRELEAARRADQAASSKRTGSRYDSLDMP